jgi:hypothetical protein
LKSILARKSLSRQVVAEEFSGKISGSTAEEGAYGEREALVNQHRRIEEPGPVSGRALQSFSGLFHPDASTVAEPHCAPVSEILIPG